VNSENIFYHRKTTLFHNIFERYWLQDFWVSSCLHRKRYRTYIYSTTFLEFLWLTDCLFSFKLLYDGRGKRKGMVLYISILACYSRAGDIVELDVEFAMIT